jgi:hypothetical protein
VVEVQDERAERRDPLGVFELAQIDGVPDLAARPAARSM